MTAFRLNVEAEEFARVLTNALAFFPARSQVKTAELAVSPERITATGTDAYTIGRDWCEPHTWQSSERVDDAVRIELDRDGWRTIEEQARKDKGTKGKPSTGVLEYRPGDCLTYHPGNTDKAEIATAQDRSQREWDYDVAGVKGREFWDMCTELLTRLDGEPSEVPHRLTFDPALFGRFQKVKVSKAFDAEKVLDFVYQGQSEPMLAKIGPTFVGAIMPIDREQYLENQPDDAKGNVWN